MTDALLLLVSDYGAVMIFAATLLSCFALPVPSSLMMMAGGTFAASGDLVLWEVCVAALTGALMGDQTGYWVGRRGGGAAVWKRLMQRQQTARLLGQAEALVVARGGVAVFLTRWLFSPLGPYVNLVAGATGMRWRRFALADLAGEITWVGVYVALGYAFSTHIEQVSDTLGNVIGALTAGVVTLLLGRALWRGRALARSKPSGAAQVSAPDQSDLT
ncbi:MAG: DedA family protein [Paracoccaceae bacterium]|nr:DedA family protein [Paracoccaceae bacterium]